MPKCEQCGREFKNDLALRIHVGKSHSKKAKAKAAGKSAATGALTCGKCGRKFKLPMHLGRHMTFAHRKATTVGKVRKVKRQARRAAAVPAAPAELDVRSMTVDQLLVLKGQLDRRLRHIAQRMRQARIRL